MSFDRSTAPERATDNRPRCQRSQIYDTADNPGAYWGRRRAPRFDDELGAEVVIDGLGVRLAFTPIDGQRGWFFVKQLPPQLTEV